MLAPFVSTRSRPSSCDRAVRYTLSAGWGGGGGHVLKTALDRHVPKKSSNTRHFCSSASVSKEPDLPFFPRRNGVS